MVRLWRPAAVEVIAALKVTIGGVIVVVLLPDCTVTIDRLAAPRSIAISVPKVQTEGDTAELAAYRVNCRFPASVTVTGPTPFPMVTEVPGLFAAKAKFSPAAPVVNPVDASNVTVPEVMVEKSPRPAAPLV